jgi:glucose/arabinose dehydrogenase
MFVGQHGSWNRKPHSGYRSIHRPILRIEESAQGVAIDKRGAMVADDVGGMVWRVSAAASMTP